MSHVWAVIVSVILILIIYAIISDKISHRKKIRIREKTIPLIKDCPTTMQTYNIHTSNGHQISRAKILGSVEGEDANFSFAGYDGMLVIELNTGKKAYLKKSSIRYMEET